MEELYFNPNWNYKELSMNLKTLRILYWQKLASFYYFDIKKVIEFKRKTRDIIYSYPFKENLKDIAWEYLNYQEWIRDSIEIDKDDI